MSIESIDPDGYTEVEVFGEVIWRGNVSLKDDPRDTPTPPQVPETVTAVEEPTAAKYRAILVKHRRTQLETTRENLQRLAQTYDRAAEIILERVRALPDSVERTGTGWLRAQLQAMGDVRRELDRLRTDYATLLDLSMISSAQAAADREAEVARLVGAPIDTNLYVTAERAATLTNGTGLSVRFGALAKEAVEGVVNRYYRDGLVLSQRLWNLAEGTRTAVEDTIAAGLASGQSARNLATELQRVLSEDGVETPRYNAMRIARTEINNSFREAHLRSVIDPSTGMVKSFLVGIRWSLSTSHKDPDMCDLYAAHDEGLGGGIYRPDSLPVSHPHCMCHTSSVLKDFPDVGISDMEPDVSAVPESMIAYYAETVKDPVAVAHLARGSKSFVAAVRSVVGAVPVPAEVKAERGEAGERGVRGPMGLRGERGHTGANGTNGKNGKDGRDGDPGPEGQKGPAGNPGTAGPTGPKGDRGPAGLPGIEGKSGRDGKDGKPGPKGEDGKDGAPGPQGKTGPKGDTGVRGPTGPTGPIGERGEKGVKGDKGEPGPIGWTGETGALGPHGPKGEPGRDGKDGKDGPRGLAGVTGAKGEPGLEGKSGKDGAAGPKGERGPKGDKGDKGEKGLNWRGEWSSDTVYDTDDAVYYGGSSYVALEKNLLARPTQDGWSLLARKGKDGAKGPHGERGAQGTPGTHGWSLPGPTGATGATGATGPAGASGAQSYIAVAKWALGSAA